MSYYRHFGLEREPFGTTPDPSMFYKTLGHHHSAGSAGSHSPTSMIDGNLGL